jgi:hypothetical protein
VSLLYGYSIFSKRIILRGLIGLISVGIAIIFEMRKNRGFFERLSDLFKDSIQITVDEKIAMLYSDSLSLPKFSRTQEELNLIISRIKSDLNLWRYINKNSRQFY